MLNCTVNITVFASNIYSNTFHKSVEVFTEMFSREKTLSQRVCLSVMCLQSGAHGELQCPGPGGRILPGASALNDKAFADRCGVMQSERTEGDLCAASPGLANPAEILAVF